MWQQDAHRGKFSWRRLFPYLLALVNCCAILHVFCSEIPADNAMCGDSVPALVTKLVRGWYNL